MEGQKLYSTSEAAAECGISVPLLTKLARTRGIGMKVGSRYVFTEEDLEVVRSRPKQPGRPTQKASGSEDQDANGSPSPNRFGEDL